MSTDIDASVRAYLSHMRPSEEIDARGIARALHVDTLGADYALERAAKAGHATTTDNKWYRRAARSKKASKPRATCSVAKYLEVLSHELVRYDVKTCAAEDKRIGRHNIYRLALLMGAMQRVRENVGTHTSDSDGDKADFRMAMYAHFERDFPPVKKVIKQLDAGTCKVK